MSCPDQIQSEFSVAKSCSLVRILWQQLNRICLYRSLCAAHKTIYVPLYNDTELLRHCLSIIAECDTFYSYFTFQTIRWIRYFCRVENIMRYFFFLVNALGYSLSSWTTRPDVWCRPDNQCDDFRTTRDLVLNNHILSSMVSLDDKAYSRESRKE